MNLLDQENFISTKEASERSGYNSDYLARLCRQHKITGAQIGRAWVIEKTSLDTFVKEQGARKQERSQELSRAREQEYRSAQTELTHAAPVASPYVAELGKKSLDVLKKNASTFLFVRDQAIAISTALAVTLMSVGIAQAGAVSHLAVATQTAAVAVSTSATAYLAAADVTSSGSLAIARGNVRTYAAHVSPVLSTRALKTPEAYGAFATTTKPAPVLAQETRLQKQTAFYASLNSATTFAVAHPVDAAGTSLRALARTYVALGLVSLQQIDGVLAEYRAQVEGAGATSFALADRIDDTTLAAPSALALVSERALDAYATGVYGWVDASPRIAEVAVNSVYAMGDTLAQTSVQLPTQTTTAYDAGVLAVADGAQSAIGSLGDAQQGTAFGLVAGADASIAGMQSLTTHTGEALSLQVANAQDASLGMAGVGAVRLMDTRDAVLSMPRQLAAVAFADVMPRIFSVFPQSVRHQGASFALAVYDFFHQAGQAAGRVIVLVQNNPLLTIAVNTAKPALTSIPFGTVTLPQLNAPTIAFGGNVSAPATENHAVVASNPTTVVHNYYYSTTTTNGTINGYDEMFAMLTNIMQRQIDAAVRPNGSGGGGTNSGDTIIVQNGGGTATPFDQSNVAITGGTIGGVTITGVGTLNVTGSSTLASTSISNANIGNTTIGNATIGDAHVTGNVVIDGNLTVLGSTTITVAASNGAFNDVAATNANFVNSTTTNATTTNFYAANGVIGTLLATVAHLVTATIDTLNATTATIASLTGTNSNFINATTTNATSTNQFATNLGATNFTLGNSVFTSLLGFGLTNQNGALSVSTSSLATTFFKNGGNTFGTNSVLGTLDNYALSFITNGATRLTLNALGNALFSGDVTAANLNATGTLTAATTTTGSLVTTGSANIGSLTVGTLNGILHATGGLVSASQVLLGSDVSGVLPVSNGGTGTSSFGGTNTLLYTTSANTIASVPSGNNGVVITNGSGAPSVSQTLPTAVQQNIDAANIANFGSPFYTLFHSTTTDALAEGSTNKYYTDARARNAISNTALGLSYSNSTGVLSLTSGYSIPLTASTTDWNTAYQNRITSATTPLTISGNTISIAQASGSAAGYLSSADWTLFNSKVSSTSLSATGPLAYNSGTGVFSLGTVGVANGGTGSTTLTGILLGNGTGAVQTLTVGNGLLLSSGILSVSTTSLSGSGSNFNADFLDGLDSTYFLANSFSTTSANAYLATKSTSNLAEGSNLYFTPARVAGVLAATTTDALAEGSTNLYYTTGRVQSFLNTIDKGYFFSTTSANYFLQGANISGFSTTSADYYLTTKTSDNLAEGSTNKYYTDARARNALSSSATGLTYNSSTGVFSLTSGYTIPLTASTSDWNTAYANRITSVSAPLVLSGNSLSITQASRTQNGYLGSADFTAFDNKVSSTSLSATGPLAYNSSTGVFSLGTVGVVNGGTGSTTLSGLLKGNGTGAILTAIAGTDYFVPSAFGSSFYTFFHATTTDALAEGSTNLYYTDARARAALSSTATGLSYSSLTGVFSLTSGYAIPLSASTTDWNTAYQNRITSASAPLTISGNAISISQASGSTNGFLASADWNIFNNKVSSTSLSATGPLAYNSSTGVFSLGTVGVGNGGTGIAGAPAYGQVLLGNGSGGYTLTATSSLGIAAAFTATYPIVYSANNLSLAFGTTTSNTWAGTQTFTNPIAVGSGSGTSTFNGNIGITGNIIPSADNTYSLGSLAYAWKDVYVGPGSLYVNDQEVIHTDASQNVVVSSDANQNLVVKTTGTANIEINPSGSGQILLKNTINVSAGKSITTSDLSALPVPNGVAAGNITIVGNAVTASNLNGGISLTPSGSGGTYVTAGNFGVGTTSPLNKFEVNGNSLLAGNATILGTTTSGNIVNNALATNALIYSNGVKQEASVTIGSGLAFSGGTLSATVSTTSLASGFFQQGGNTFGTTATLGTTDNNALRFLSNNLERARFDTAGNFGIGTTSPSQALSVNGNAYVNGTVTAGNITLLGAAAGITQCLHVNGAGQIYGTGTDCGSGSGTGNGTVTSIDASGGTTGLSFSGGPITTFGTLTLSGTLTVSNGGTGSTTLTGILKGNGTGSLLSAVAGTDYLAPGSLSAGTGISYSGGVITNTGVTSAFGRTGAVVATSGDYTTTLVTEGTNLYYTAARFASALAGTTTDALAEGSTNLYYTTGRVQTFLNAIDKGYFFSTTSANYFLSVNQGAAFSTTSANAYLATKTTDNLTEGSANKYFTNARVATVLAGTTTDALAEGTNNLYFTNARARAALSSTATGLTYNSTTGVFSLTSGYNIPTTASTSAWDSFYQTPSTRITAGTNLAWSGNTLNGPADSYIRGLFSATSPISYNSTTGVFSFATSTVSGSGSNLNADFLDGLDSTYFLANSFSTTSANYFLAQNQGNAYSTTSANYWLTTKTTTNLAEGTNLYYTDARVQTFLNAIDKGYFFSTTSANAYLATKSTTNLTEGSNLYYTDTRARAALSSTATGLTYTTGTGVFSLTSGYSIPLTASTTDWNTAYVNRITSASAPLVISGNAISINQASRTQNGFLSSADFVTFDNKVSSTSLSATGPLAYNSSTGVFSLGTVGVANGGTGSTTLTGILLGNGTGAVQTLTIGNGLTFGGTTLSISTSTISGSGSNFNADFLDGLDSLYLLANSFSTTSANAYLATKSTTDLSEGTNLYYTNTRVQSFLNAIDKGYFFSTTSANYFLGTKTTDNLAEGSINKYYTDARARAALSETVTGLDYNNSTGVLSLTSGYVIPTTASTTDWNTAYQNRITSASAPLTISGNSISISQASRIQNGYLSSADFTTFDNKVSSTSLSATGPIAYNSSTGVFSLGTVGVANGGTGSTTLTGILLGNGTGAIQTLTIGNGLMLGGTTLSISTSTISGSGSGFNADFLDGLDSTYFLANSFSTTSANAYLATKSTTNLAEGSNLYYTDARARAALSSTATGLTYTSGTGVFSLTAGYTIPLTASTTDWNTAYINRITSASTPLTISGNAISISQASRTTNGFLSSVDFTAFDNKISSTSLSATGPLTYNSSTGVFGLGTVGVANGGTGSTTLSGILIGNGTSALQTLTVGSGLSLVGTTLASTVSTTSLALDSQYFKQGGNAYAALASLGTTDNNALAFITNNVERGRFTAAGNFGIGTSTPGSLLTIAGVPNIQLSQASGGVGIGARLSYDQLGNARAAIGLGTQTGGAGYLSFLVGAGNIEAIRIDGAGNVGIGTTTPNVPLSVAYSNNTYGFGIELTNTNTGTSALTGIGLNNSSGTRVGQFVYVPSNYGVTALQNQVLFSSVGNVGLTFDSNAGNAGGITPNIDFQAGDTSRVKIIGSTGNVGIGTTTPSAKLDVYNGVLRATGSYGAPTSGQGLEVGYISTYGQINSYNRDAGAYTQLRIDGSSIILNGTSAGNVGIGTSTPSQALSVQGNGLFSGNISAANLTATGTATVGSLTLGGSNFTSLLGNGLSNVAGVLTVSTSSLASGFFQQGGNTFGALATLGTTDNNALRFITNNVERGRFDTNGNFGIGTTSPYTALSVVGTVKADKLTLSNTSGYALQVEGQTGTGIYRDASTNSLSLLVGTGGLVVTSTGLAVDNAGFGTVNAYTSDIPTNKYLIAINNGSGTYNQGIYYANGALSFPNNSVGIKTVNPQSTFDVNGNAAIGSYAGVTAAPTNGLIVSGNVGIGTTTPSQRLSVQGNALFSGDISAANLTATGTATVGSLTLGGSNFTSLLGNGLSNVAGVLTVSTSSLASGFFQQNGNSFGALATLGTTDNNALRFITNNVERGRFDTNGNFGIGTTSPSSALTVQGTIGISNGGTTGIGTIYNDGNVHIAAEGTSVTALILSGGNISFRPTANGSTFAVFTPTSSYVATGNVGIGLVSPAYKLDVAGFVNVDQYSGYKQNGSTILYASSTNHAVIIGTSAGGINISSSTIQDNIAIGYQALASGSLAAGGNVAIGTWSLLNTTTGGLNTSVGALSMLSNLTGNWNTGIGNSALGNVNSANNNTALGYYAGRGAASATGAGNTFLGSSAGTSFSTGANNAAVGSFAMFANTTGGSNSVLGSQALYYNGSATNTVAIGFQAGYGVSGQTASQFNVFIGNQSDYANTTGSNNFYGGYQAGFYASSTNDNVALGYQALYGNASLNTGYDNVAIGREALKVNSSGAFNTALGYQAGIANSTGQYNLFAGAQAGYKMTSGSSNSYLGNQAGYNATSTTLNTGVGYGALYGDFFLGNGFGNSALGSNALYSVSSGVYNNAFGVSALNQVTKGSYNVGIGDNSLSFLQTGSNNVAIGASAGYAERAATSTVFIGYFAGYGNGTSYSNQGGVVLGNQAGYNFQSGSDYNTLHGYKSGYGITTGARNVLIGQSTIAASYNQITTGSSNIAIGDDVAVPSATASNQLVIGNLIYGTGLSGTGSTISTGNIGIGTTSPIGKLSIASDGTVNNQFLRLEDTAASGKSYALVNRLNGVAGTFSIYDATAAASRLAIDTNGNVGISSTSPSSLLSVGSTNGINFSTATSTFSSTGGINLANGGCFAIAGVCVGGNNLSFTYPLVNTANTISLAFGTTTANKWSSLQTFNGGFLSTASSTVNGLFTASNIIDSGLTPNSFVYSDGSNQLTSATLGSGLSFTGGTISVSNSSLAGNFFQQGGNSFGAAGVLGTADNNPLTFITNNVERARFDVNGRLGIGTTNPAESIQVGTSIDNTDKAVKLIYSSIPAFYSTTYTGSQSVSALSVNTRPTGSTFTTTGNASFGNLAVQLLSGTGTNSRFAFSYGAPGSGVPTMSELFTITSAGNVGIATTSPQAALGLQGAIGVNNKQLYFTADGRIVVNGTGINSGEITRVTGLGANTAFDVCNTTSGTSCVALDPGVTTGIADIYSSYLSGSEPKLHLSTYANKGTANGITIDTTGNIGLGISTPLYPLDVASSSGVRFGISSGRPIVFDWTNATDKPRIAALSASNFTIESPSSAIGLVPATNSYVAIGAYGYLQLTDNLTGLPGTNVGITDNTNKSFGFLHNGNDVNTAGFQFYAPSTGLATNLNFFSIGQGARSYLTILGSNGNVGIGTGSTTAAYKLDVAGGFVNVDQYSGYKQAGNTVVYASTTRSTLYLGSEPSFGSATNNIAIGTTTLKNNVVGINNVALGVAALYSNAAGGSNVAIGSNALYSNLVDNNVGIGSSALYSNSTGNSNVALGTSALYNNTGGSYNIALGTSALYSGGSNSIGIGYNTLSVNSGTGNVALGSEALGSATSGDYNTALGYFAGTNHTSGSRNITIGSQDSNGDGITNGSNNILIGNNISAANGSASNQLNIGNLLYGTGLSGTGSTLSSGNIGIGITAPATRLHIAGPGGSFPPTAQAFITDSSSATSSGLGIGYETADGVGAGYIQAGVLGGASTAPLLLQPFGGVSSFGGALTVNGATVINGANTTNGVTTLNGNLIGNGAATFTGSVGIGTTTPGANLDIGGGSFYTSARINGNASGTAGGAVFTIANNSSYVGSIGNYSAVAGGAYNNTLAIASANNLIIQAGSVGIGTTTFAANFSVQGSQYISGVSTVGSLTIGGISSPNFTSLLGNGLTNVGGVLTVSTSSLATGFFKQSGNAFGALAVLGTTDNNALSFITNNVERGRFDTSGNFGIGTTSPSAKLAVAGDIWGNNIIPNGPYTTNLSAYSLGSSAQRWNTVWTGTLNVGTSTMSLKANANSGLGFFTQASGAGTEALTIATNGNIGIGSTTPGSLLSVGLTNGINFSTATSTFSSTGGINLTNGCYAVNGTCLSTGGTNYFTNSGNVTTLSTGTFLNVPANGGYYQGGQLLGYASSTNGVALFGLNSGGTIATTSATYTGNTAFGNYVLSSAIAGAVNNIGVGNSALYLLSSGTNNVAVGAGAGYSITTGINNEAIGGGALGGGTNTIGNDNLAVGYFALGSTNGVSGANNIALGNSALVGNGSLTVSGSDNFAAGYNALFKLSSGARNVGIGYSALYGVTSGFDNIGLGYNALVSLSTGNSNVALSRAAGYVLTTGTDNILLGYNALGNYATSSINNVALGRNALGNVASSSNIALGNSAGLGTASGARYAGRNIFLGDFTGKNLVSGTNDNVLIGYGVGQNISGINNVVLGSNAVSTAALSGNSNVVLGFNGGYNLSSGSGNILIGSATSTANANLTTGYGNIIIGNNIQAPSATGNGQLNIGNIIYGTGLTGTGSTIAGNIGIGTTSPQSKLDVTGTDGTAVLTAAGATNRFRIVPTSTLVSVEATNAVQAAYAPLQLNGSTVMLSIGNTAGLTLANGGNVGIGTTTPDFKLSVQGTQLYTNDGGGGGFAVESGATPLKRIYMGYDTNIDAGFIQSVYTTNGYKNLLLNPNGGNVGIGTTTPYQNLAVSGAGLVGQVIHSTTVGSANAATLYLDRGDQANGFAGLVYSTNGTSNWTLNVPSGTNDLRFYDNSGSGAERLRIQSGTGNVGIGTTTPSSKLDVAGAIHTSSTLTLDSNNAIQFKDPSGTARRTSLWSSGNAIYYGDIDNSNNSALYLMAGGTGNINLYTNGVLRSYINSGGDFHTTGNFIADSSTLYLSSSYPTVAHSGTYNIYYDGSSNGAILAGGTGDPENYYRNTTHVFGSISGATTYASLNATGLGVGTAPGGWSGNAQLSTAAANSGIWALSAYQANAGNGAVLVRVDSTSAYESAYYYGSSLVGSITTNGSSITYNTTSDRRLKDNIAITTRGLETLRQIDIDDFNFKSMPNDRVQGYIAQQLYPLYPEAVHVGGDDVTTNPWSVDYGRLTPLVIRSVQQLADQSDRLSTTTLGLSTTTAALSTRISFLESFAAASTTVSNVAANNVTAVGISAATLALSGDATIGGTVTANSFTSTGAINAASVSLTGGVGAASVTTTGDVLGARFIAPIIPGNLDASTTPALPTEVLTADALGVDMMKLAMYSFGQIASLASRMDVLSMKVDAFDTRIAALESASSSMASSTASMMASAGGALGLSSSTVLGVLHDFGIMIGNGIAQFGTLVTHNLVFSKDTNGDSAAGSDVVISGNLTAEVHNPNMKATSKVSITFTSQVIGSWYLSEKKDGSFRVTLSQAQSTDTTFDYFIVQTEGQIGPVTAPAPTAPPVEPPANNGSTTPPQQGSGTGAPTVTLNGDAAVQIAQGGNFIDPGATASDATDGDLTSSIVVTGTVDAGTPGTYTVTYTATNAAGVSGNASRIVTVLAPMSAPSGSSDSGSGTGESGSGSGSGSDEGTTTP